MINYILISTLFNVGHVAQTATTFADKASCESAAIRQEVIYKQMVFVGKWNLTCHPYQIGEVKK